MKPRALLLTLAAMAALVAGWWALTPRGTEPAGRRSSAPATQNLSQLLGRGDALAARLGERLGPLWAPDSPPPDSEPARAPRELVRYAVQGGEAQAPAGRTWRAVPVAHQRAWGSAKGVLPPELLGQVRAFVLSSDGRGGQRGRVAPTDGGLGGWQLSLDPRDSAASARIGTLVAQSAWLLGQGPREVQPLLLGDTCATLTVSAGCLQAGGLMHRYVQTFWPNALLRDWRQRRVAGRPGAATAFFAAHPGTFVNAGAARGPEQDFAAAWTAFVLGPRPAEPQTVAERKVAFFASQPDLAALRLDLLRRMAQAYPAK